eukprot:GDKH01023949.1.p3 GENE.GDKH01023949.1~~GDKH01023949.1.p3  ORF type:complete len:56 (+),score=7.43 GDKH01023949.1:2-169(+)
MGGAPRQARLVPARGPADCERRRVRGLRHRRRKVAVRALVGWIRTSLAIGLRDVE